jgi:hypothetical protein
MHERSPPPIWHVNDNPAIWWAGTVAIILILFILKFIVLHRIRDRNLAVFTYVAAVAAAVPALWLLDPDWDSIHLDIRIHYLSMPVAVLTVPYASFVLDLLRREFGATDSGLLRLPFELLLLVPAWFIAVGTLTLFLGWVWI